jgi:hypothetical protein
MQMHCFPERMRNRGWLLGQQGSHQQVKHPAPIGFSRPPWVQLRQPSATNASKKDTMNH